MNISADTFLNPWVVLYLAVVFGGQWTCEWAVKRRRARIAARRAALGLPADILMDHAEQLSQRRRQALLQSAVLLITMATPILIVAVAEKVGYTFPEHSKNGLAVTFVGILVWALISGTDVAKAFLGGLAFKTMVALKTPFQVGDRVTLMGIGGRVVSFDTFFVTLVTLSDDKISIPTAGLWSEVLNTSNDGDRSSLSVMEFYLAPFVSAEVRLGAEDAIWNAIQASVYFDPARPVQIYLRQNPDSIQLTAKAYVGSTYDEPLFTSDVTRAFLDHASSHEIALASPAWRTTAAP